MKFSDLRPYLIRLAIVGLISLVFALVFNEVTYLLSKDPADRAPKTITLVIPAGTKNKEAAVAFAMFAVASLEGQVVGTLTLYCSKSFLL
jgi:hypothetical protein